MRSSWISFFLTWYLVFALYSQSYSLSFWNSLYSEIKIGIGRMISYCSPTIHTSRTAFDAMEYHNFDLGNFILKAFSHCFRTTSLFAFPRFHLSGYRFRIQFANGVLVCVWESVCLCDDYESDVGIHLVILTEMCKHDFKTS